MNELERVWKESDVAKIEVLSRDLTGGAEVNREKFNQDSQSPVVP
jgi:hypothetical protein